jgi:hypothetical protein
VALGKRCLPRAPGIKNKLLYLVMPPGWSHTGDHKMTTVVKEKYFKDLQQQNKEVAPTNA